MQAAAVRWGFAADDVGLVTGHRKVNPQARVLVVVAEILLNRLLQPEDTAEAALFLATAEARSITGINVSVNAGTLIA